MSRAVTAARRDMVARLHLRGFTQREIQRALKTQRMLNPRSGKPWSLGTVNRDLQALSEEWEEQALEARQKKKAQSNAELEEMKRQAWKEGDTRLALEILREQNKLFALYDPVEVNVHEQVTHEHRIAAMEAAVAEMGEAELDALIADLFLIADVEPDAIPAVIDGEYRVEEE